MSLVAYPRSTIVARELSRLTRVAVYVACIAASVALGGCKIFSTTCKEDDRTCLNGGLLRSGDSCIRSGDCAAGLNCVKNVCAYAGSSKANAKCVASAECGAGLYCSPQVKCEPINPDAQKVGGPCGISADCEKGLACDADVSTLFATGPFGDLSPDCQLMLSSSKAGDLPDSCKLPKKCVMRGTKDTSTACKTSSECLAGLYCVKFDDPLTMKPVQQCIGSPDALSQEPISIPSWDGATCAKDDATTPTAYFDVPRDGDKLDFYRLPFPNDIRRKGDTIDLSAHPVPPASTGVPVVETLLSAAGGLHGFGTNPVAYFRFSEPIDASRSSLNGQTLHIIDISQGSPSYNQLASIEWSPSGLTSHYICPNWLGVRHPIGSPLRPGTTYAAVLTRGVKTAKHMDFKRSADLDALLGGVAPSDSALAQAYSAYAPVRAWLAGGSPLIAETDILNVAVFTTQKPEDVMPALRTAITKHGAPKLKDDMMICKDGGPASPCEDALGRGKCNPESKDFIEIHGHIELPIFQKGTPPYEKPEQGGQIDIDGNGNAVVQSNVVGTDGKPALVCFALAVPKKAAPAAGYPVMIYAHGTGGSFNSQMAAGGLASDVATGARPGALLAIDMPEHGSRRGASLRPPEDLFFNFLNPQGARGNVLQGSADLMSLALLVHQGSIDAASSPTKATIKFDTKHVMFFGHSQGATHAAIALPFEGNVQAGVLSGIGGHLATSLLNKKKPVDIGAILPFVLFDADSSNKLVGGTYNPVLSILQMFFESSDPINYGHRVFHDPAPSAPTGHDLFMTYGLNDSYAPEKTQEAYARSADLTVVSVGIPFVDLGLTTARPPLRDNANAGTTMRTVGLRQYDPTASMVDGHFVATETPEGRADVLPFVHDVLNGDRPQIGAAP